MEGTSDKSASIYFSANRLPVAQHFDKESQSISHIGQKIN
jgi:hypothetical protein